MPYSRELKVHIYREVFSKPSEGVRGVVTLFMCFGSGTRERRVGHALLQVGKPAQVALTVPVTALSVDDLVRLSGALDVFAKEVADA